MQAYLTRTAWMLRWSERKSPQDLQECSNGPATDQAKCHHSLKLAQLLAKGSAELGAMKTEGLPSKVLGTSVRQVTLLTIKTGKQNSRKTHDCESHPLLS